MWSLLFAIALLASAHGQEKKPRFGGLMDAARGMLALRSDANSVRLAGLENQVDDLSKQLEGLGDVPDFKDLRIRVEKLEGSRCGDDEYDCGGAASQCVGRLLVCDGLQDCRNGKDEVNCDNMRQAGSSWQGFVSWTGCTHTRVETPVRMMITGVNKSEFYGGQVGLTFTIALEVKDRVGAKRWISSSHVGYWNAGSRNLVVEPAGERGLGLTCNFDGNNWSRCNGQIMHAGSYSSCGTALMVKQ